jgi:hypothetical protein
MKARRIMMLAASAAFFGASPALSLTWSQVTPYVWLDASSISTRDGLTYFVAVHARSDGNGNWLPPDPAESAKPSDLKAYDCGSGQFYAHQKVYPGGMTEEQFRKQYEEWDEEFGYVTNSEYHAAWEAVPTELRPAGPPDKRGELYLRICGAP